MTFAEQMEIQRKRQERRMENLVKRTLSFAEELKRIDLSFGERYSAEESASQGDLE